ncbi:MULTISPECIES: hypothetical protein [unclassified Moorena]|uniref:hypothetical protein n=1 Tax=unclassified Moorena TaxID=2683338 RepID=UPI0013C97C4B|nr:MULTISPECIES: hypothetical protein [unclassified Moorena]NEO20958.1 hypothetical protein [Moorena sp. SIO4A5]NEQ60028.1 hypothetical protein [Moorena sp. SIO4A1]
MLNKDQTLTEAAGLGIAGTIVIGDIMQNSPELKNIIKNFNGNPKLIARVVARLLEEPEIANTVVDVSNNDEFKKGVSNLDNKLRQKFRKIGLSMAKRYNQIMTNSLKIVFENNNDMFSMEHDNLKTLEYYLRDLLANANNFIENFTNIGSEVLHETGEVTIENFSEIGEVRDETIELLEDAGEVTPEVMDSLVGFLEWIGEII